MDSDDPRDPERALSRGEVLDALESEIGGEIEGRGVTGADRILRLACPPTVLEIGLANPRDVGETDLVIESAWPLAGGPRFELVDDGTWRSWLRTAGSEAIEIGHEAFDERFRVRGGPAEEVRTVLLGAADALLAHEPSTCRSTATSLKLAWSLEVSPNLRSLREIVDAARTLATADLYGREALEGLAGVRVQPPAQLPGLETYRVERPTPVWLRPELDGSEIVTVAWVRDDGGEREVPALDRLSGRERALARRSGAQRLERAGGELRLAWPQVCRQPDALDAGARLLAGLSGPVHGIYR